MPRITRKRTISVEAGDVWGLVSDPYNLPRWWPRTTRVESVEGEGDGAEWTSVLGTADGRGVRADFRCRESVAGERHAWEQLIEGTPFARHLRRYRVEVALRRDGARTEVSIAVDQALRGLSRLGSPMMRRGQGALLDEALDGIERAVL
ncbi:MAG TPA: SRPBCC family protein [Solirubrobacterales bacterium]|nr:SRPBCC family protein [Solirubrobacterales bacterium]